MSFDVKVKGGKEHSYHHSYESTQELVNKLPILGKVIFNDSSYHTVWHKMLREPLNQLNKFIQEHTLDDNLKETAIDLKEVIVYAMQLEKNIEVF